MVREYNPLNFGGLNANCCNTVTDTDFKFDKHVPWDSPDMSFKNFSKRGHTKVTFPAIFLGVKC